MHLVFTGDFSLENVSGWTFILNDVGVLKPLETVTANNDDKSTVFLYFTFDIFLYFLYVCPSKDGMSNFKQLHGLN